MQTEICRAVTNYGHTRTCSHKAIKDGFCGYHHPDIIAKRKAQAAEKTKTNPLRVRIAELEKQRDELLAAAIGVKDHLPLHRAHIEPYRSNVARFRAAIAKAQGVQP
jgi:hypothetical protein